MSDVVRTYSRSSRHAVRRGRKGFAKGSFFFLLVCLAGCLWFFWTTRDCYPLVQMLPADQAYHVYSEDLLNRRTAIAQARVWQLLPEEHALRKALSQLPANFGMPEWVLNNLIPDDCLVVGDDLRALSDPILITRMSRIGCIAERMHRFIPDIESDYAGGLRLRYLPQAQLHYAVRGRVLLASPSRAALIKALTLRPENTMSQELLTQIQKDSQHADFVCTVQLKNGENLGGAPLGKWLDKIQLAVRIERDAMRLKCSGLLHPDMQAQWAALLSNATPGTLQAPPDGMLGVSLDLGKSTDALIRAIDDGLNGAVSLEATLQQWAQTPEYKEWAPHCLALLQQLGPGCRLSWRGVDTYAIFPMPEIVATFDTHPDALSKWFENLPVPAPEVMPWETFLRGEEEREVAWLPLIGGPSIEPTLASYNHMALLSTSHTLAETLLEKPKKSEALPQKGNLFVQLRPAPALDAVASILQPLADLNLIRGYDAATFQEAMQAWQNQFQSVQEVALLAGHKAGELHLEFRLILQAS